MGRHEVQAEFLRAVGQTTGLRILEVLAKGERCVCNIYQAIGEEQSNVSNHTGDSAQDGGRGGPPGGRPGGVPLAG